MKGLLIKDFRIFMQHNKTLLIMVFIGGFLLITGGDLGFVVAYLTMMAAFLVLGTISYDEADSGYSFLFTLTFTRNEYVLEKYVFSTAASVIVWALLNLLFAAASGSGYEAEDMLEAVSILAAIMLMQAVMLPLQLKYGAEKARVVFFLVIGIIVVIGVLLGQFGGLLPDFSQEYESLNAFYSSLAVTGIIGMQVAVSVAVILISLGISCKIMENKQM